MPRDLNAASPDDERVVPLERKSSAIKATPYIWQDPATLPLRRWIYGRQLLRGSVSVVIAPGATGKTALMIGTALALASGQSLLGKTVWDRPQVTWLWNLEDDRDELARGIQAGALHWGLTPDMLTWHSQNGEEWQTLYVDSGLDGAELKIAHETGSGARINAPVVDALVAEITERGIDVLIVDPFVSSHSVSENDNNAIDLVMKQWARLAKITGCSIVLVHHSRKLAGAEVSAETARGASALAAAARSVVALNRMSDDEAIKFGIEGEERRRYFRTYDDKNNRAPPADTSEWYRLHSVSLNNGSNGGDSMPVVVPWTPPSAFDGVSVEHLRAVQAGLAEGEHRKDPQAKPWAGEVVADVLRLNVERPADKARIKTMLRTWEENGALAVEMKPDKHRNPKPFLIVGRPALDGDAAPLERCSDAG